MGSISTINLQENTKILNFLVYPTISKGKISIENDDIQNLINLDIININGQIVYSSQITERKTILNLNLISGCYFVRLENKSLIGVKKIIIE
jgi:hypothetical protein